MISACFTVWNRDSLLFEAFRYIVTDERVTEIVIVDDHSDMAFYNNVVEMTKGFDKVRLYRNAKNLGCYFNKTEAVSKASNEWVCLLDSDNVFKKDYIDALCRYNTEHGWQRDTILAPEYARPAFDYTHFSGQTITRQNVAKLAVQKRFDCLINTANYFVHRDEYLKVFDRKKEPWTADTMYQNRNWLIAGNKIHVLPGLQYDHLIHTQSHYQQFNKRTNGLDKKLEREFKLMR